MNYFYMTYEGECRLAGLAINRFEGKKVYALSLEKGNVDEIIDDIIRLRKKVIDVDYSFGITDTSKDRLISRLCFSTCLNDSYVIWPDAKEGHYNNTESERPEKTDKRFIRKVVEAAINTAMEMEGNV